MNANLRNAIEMAAKAHRDFMYQIEIVQRLADKGGIIQQVAEYAEACSFKASDFMKDLEAKCYEETKPKETKP